MWPAPECSVIMCQAAQNQETGLKQITHVRYLVGIPFIFPFALEPAQASQASLMLLHAPITASSEGYCIQRTPGTDFENTESCRLN